jgi:hypothetical protein
MVEPQAEIDWQRDVKAGEPGSILMPAEYVGSSCNDLESANTIC